MRLLDKEVIKKYKILIQDVENYVLKKNGRRKATRKNWTPDDREKWKLRYPECPLCHESYDESNPITKEHITPLFLGGPERDCNVIAICHKCNKSRDKVMKKLLGTADIAEIRERWPAIKPAVDNFVIWCHITLYDYDHLHQVKDLNHAFKNERNIDFPLENKANAFVMIKDSVSFFSYLSDFFKNLFSDKHLSYNSRQDLELDSQSSPLPVEINKSPSKKENKDPEIRPNVIFDLDGWVLENWVNKLDYNNLKTQILRHEKDNGGNRKLRTILKEDFEISKAWNVEKISSYFEGIKTNNSKNNTSRNDNRKILGHDINSTEIPVRDVLKEILVKNITKRIGAHTYKDGFNISQITYIFKQSKEKYDMSWNKFFSHLGIKYEENIQKTSEKLLHQLGLNIEENLNDNGDQNYIISKSD